MSWQKVVVPSIVGCIAAVATTYLYRGISTRDTTALAPERERFSRRSVVHEVEVRSDDRRVAALEQELAELKRRLGDSNEDRPNQRPTETPDVLLEEKFARHAQAFASDPVDKAWAYTATKNLESSLEHLEAEAKFSLVQAECRTTHCRAVVEFPTLAHAEVHAGSLAEARLASLNCAQGIRLARDADPDSPVRAELFLDCTELRAGRVEALY